MFIFIYLSGWAKSWLWHMGTLVVAGGIEFPDQGLNPGLLPWAHSILATGPLGRSLRAFL